MQRGLRVILTAVFLLVLGNGALNGQIITSSIVGRVTDPSGAVVPGVSITVTNTGTNVSVQMKTDTSGTFSLTNLLTGTYDLSASKTGFGKYMRTGVQLMAQATLRVDISLKVGSNLETVTVTTAAPLVQTDSQTISTTLTTRQADELPLQTELVAGLLTLVAGSEPGTYMSNPVSGGAPYWGGTDWSVNGMSVNDVGDGGAPYTVAPGGNTGLMLLPLPWLDSIQELKASGTDNSAEYRAINSVTIVTKQGSNKLHGMAYEDLQNAALNANTLDLNAEGIKRPPSEYNQFGANAGGPIWKDKAWFFFSYGGLRDRTYSTNTLTMPSLAMRQGDFSALCTSFVGGVCTAGTQLYNPETGLPFAQNAIPTTEFASQSNSLLAYLPQLTKTTAGLPSGPPDYIAPLSVADDVNEYQARIDYQISHSDSVYGVFSKNGTGPYQSAGGYPPEYGNDSDFGYHDYSMAVTENHTFGPTTINEFHIQTYRHGTNRYGENVNFNPLSLFPQLTPSSNRGLPAMNISGYTGMWYDRGLYSYPQWQSGLGDNLTHVHGRHTIKAGLDLTHYTTIWRNTGAPLGTFGFSGDWTGGKGWLAKPSAGNAFADFLLGDADTDSTGTAAVERVDKSYDSEYYVQDAWQATSRLTINMGIRYSYQAPYEARNNTFTLFNPSTNKLVLPENSATPTLPPVGTNSVAYNAYLAYFTTTQAVGLSTHPYVMSKNGWGPRFGFAFRPFSGTRTVLRGGYGIYYGIGAAFIGGPFAGETNPPWGGESENFATELPKTPPVGGFLPDLTFSDPFPGTNGGAASASAHPNVAYQQLQGFQLPRAQQWNLTLERQFTPNLMGRASYVGGKTDHISFYNQNINLPAVMNLAETLQQQNLIQPWNDITGVYSAGAQNFNQLQLEVVRRFSKSISFQAEYAWTQSLDDVPGAGYGSVQVWQDPQRDYGNSPAESRHDLAFNYIWYLPFGRGMRWLGNSRNAVDALLGGWEVSGITLYRTGWPVTPGTVVPPRIATVGRLTIPIAFPGCHGISGNQDTTSPQGCSGSIPPPSLLPHPGIGATQHAIASLGRGCGTGT